MAATMEGDGAGRRTRGQGGEGGHVVLLLRGLQVESVTGSRGGGGTRRVVWGREDVRHRAQQGGWVAHSWAVSLGQAWWLFLCGGRMQEAAEGDRGGGGHTHHREG